MCCYRSNFVTFFQVFAATMVCAAPCAGARGINTFIAPDFPKAGDVGSVLSSSYVVRSDLAPAGSYVPIPLDQKVAPPPLRLTVAGKVVRIYHDMVRAANSDRPSIGVGGAPAIHDPVSGAAIGPFGEAYGMVGPPDR